MGCQCIFDRISKEGFIFTTGFAVFMLYYLPYYQDNISSFIFPAIIIFVISWMIASFFMVVLQVAVDTIFLCFLIDETVHDSPKFASPKLTQMATIAHESYHHMGSDEEDDGNGEAQTVQMKGKTNTKIQI